MNQHVKYLGQRSFHSSYCPDTQTNTPMCSNWTTRVVGKNQPTYFKEVNTTGSKWVKKQVAGS